MKELKALLGKLPASIIPKNKKIWVFGAWSGKLYADNSKYLFEYINSFHPEIKAVWITKSDDVFKQVREKGYRCYKYNTFNGIVTCLRAKVAFETEGNQDIAPYLSTYYGFKTIVIQLWHGMGAKSCDWKEWNKRRSKKGRIINWINTNRNSNRYWTATSQLYIDLFKKTQMVPEKQFRLTGYPRNDSFVDKPKNEFIENLISMNKGYRFVVYMPTHRNFGHSGNKHINIEEFQSLDKKLGDYHIKMLYKPHIHELKNFDGFEHLFNNIIFAKDQSIYGDVYSYLHYFDLLISDYSSVVYDFACSHKPVVLFPYDIDNYKNTDCGLEDFYWTLPVGPFCYNWNDVISETNNLLANDSWSEQREKNNRYFHEFNDGKNCERVYKAVLDIISK